MKYLVVLFLFVAGNIHSQVVEIKGRILNSTTMQPIPLTNIIIKGKEIGTATDENGNFLLKGDFTNNDIMRISHIAFGTREISVEEFLFYQIKDIILESKVITSQTVLIKGSIGKEGITPISFSKITREDFSETYTYQDIPEVISYLPSATFYSENGNGLGYNYLSIRGFDQRRISVAINGIPQNDPEDHNVYWLDFPDLLESTELIQVQRGAGSGIIGYPAVGGAINIITSSFSDKPNISFSALIGSFNTRKYSTTLSSGLINNKYSVYAKLSQTLSSGYRNSSWVNFKSYHLSVARYDDNLTTQVNIFGGPIEDGLAYNGLPKFAIKDRNLRRENYSYWEAINNKYTYTLDRRTDEIENFSQPHFELLNEYKVNDDVTLNSAIFLVLGTGFFDYDGSWSIYYDDYFRLKENGYDTLSVPTNALIRAQVENRQWGWIPRMSIKHIDGELILGGELRIHRSVHWGSINYGENLPVGLTKDFRYYYYEGAKDMVGFYVNENYSLTNQINILAEVQLAYHNYKITNEKYLNNEFAINNLFFNPRFGVNYKFNPYLNIYLTYAKVSREPRLKNYYDAAESSGGAVPQFGENSLGAYDLSKPLVKPETMNNIEIGASYNQNDISASLNFFYMLFNDEIVKYGQIDRFGQPITGNMKKTIHYGLESSIIFKPNEYFEYVVNGSLSKNFISEGETYAYFTDPITGNNEVGKIDLSNNRISGFPGVTINAILKFRYERLSAQISCKYVGDFFTDNYDNNLMQYLVKYPCLMDYTDNKVDAYFTTNFYASYNFNLEPFIKDLKMYVQINNLFDNLYAAYGIGKEYFPAAERNFLFGIKMGI